MALCGASFIEEKKEEIDEDSLKNVVAFSCKAKQMMAPSAEGLFTKDDRGNRVDRRTKILFNNPEFCRVSYWSLCQITAKCPRGKGVGSCSVVETKDKKTIFLTCAHNLVSISIRSNDQFPFKDGLIYKARQGEDTYVLKYSADLKKARIHPKYNDQASCGFDLGLVPVVEKLGRKKHREAFEVKGKDKLKDKWQDVVWSAAEPGSIKKGMTVELAGFPGEKKGWPFTHSGEIVDVTKTDLGGYLLWYNADATTGNSGSCIMITDPKFIKSRGYKGRVKKVIVGVHTGHDATDQLNYGTLITPEIMKWIEA